VVPSVLASVCWSLQCLISTLTHRGRWWTLFLGSLVHSRCGEGGTLQTTNSAALGLPPAHGTCTLPAHSSGSRLLRRELSEAGPGLHAPPRSKPLRFRHSGSPQRRRLRWACILCPSQLGESQVMRCLASTVTATYCLSHPCRSVFWVYNRPTFSGG